MAYTAVVNPKLMAETDPLTVARINDAANPDITITGALSAASDGPNVAPSAGQVLAYDGTRWNPASTGLIPGSEKNFKATNAVAASKITISADYVVLTTTTNNIRVVSGLSATVDGTASGAVNQLDTGAIATGWYYLWIISNGTTDGGLLSLSSTAPTMPSGYTYKARASELYYSGSNFTTFYQLGRKVWIDQVAVFNGAVAVANTWEVLASTNLTNFRAAVPLGATEAFGTAGAVTNHICQLHLAGTASDGTVPGTPLNRQDLNLASTADAYGSYMSSAPWSLHVPGGVNRNLALQAETVTPTYLIRVGGYVLA